MSKSLVYALVFFTTVLALTACASPAEVATPIPETPTWTPTPEPTDTPIPTKTSTPTPTLPVFVFGNSGLIAFVDDAEYGERYTPEQLQALEAAQGPAREFLHELAQAGMVMIETIATSVDQIGEPEIDGVLIADVDEGTDGENAAVAYYIFILDDESGYGYPIGRIITISHDQNGEPLMMDTDAEDPTQINFVDGTIRVHDENGKLIKFHGLDFNQSVGEGWVVAPQGTDLAESGTDIIAVPDEPGYYQIYNSDLDQFVVNPSLESIAFKEGINLDNAIVINTEHGTFVVDELVYADTDVSGLDMSYMNLGDQLTDYIISVWEQASGNNIEIDHISGMVVHSSEIDEVIKNLDDNLVDYYEREHDGLRMIIFTNDNFHNIYYVMSHNFVGGSTPWGVFDMGIENIAQVMPEPVNRKDYHSIVYKNMIKTIFGKSCRRGSWLLANVIFDNPEFSTQGPLSEIIEMAGCRGNQLDDLQDQCSTFARYVLEH